MQHAPQIDLETTFSTAKLVELLQKHLADHQAEYALAMDEYKIQRSKKLDAVSAAARSTTTDEEIYKVFSEYRNLVKPVDASKMYSDYIAVLTLSTAHDSTLSIQDANRIINDEWDWAANAKLINSTYANARS